MSHYLLAAIVFFFHCIAYYGSLSQYFIRDLFYYASSQTCAAPRRQQ